VPTCTMPAFDCTASWISLLHRFTISTFHCSRWYADTRTADATTGLCTCIVLQMSTYL
jgi:hypothetical protein